MDESFIDNLHNIVLNHMADENFGTGNLASLLGLSRAQTLRKVKAATGKSVNQYIREVKLAEAAKLIKETDFTSAEIAYKVGYSSPSYFNKSFRKRYGITPGAYKAQQSTQKENDFIKDSFIVHKQTPIQKKSTKRSLIIISSILVLLLAIVANYFYENFNNKKNSETIIQDKSIAILPFKNLSSNKGNQYFADGIMEVILNHLTSIKELKVISRTSMEQYRETTKTIPEIAKELGVSYILEGSVQKNNDEIRVITQLIDAKNDKHISSTDIKKDYKDIFELQSTIANQISKELNMELSDAERNQIEKKPTNNLEAYNLYLKGRFFWHRRTEEDITKSIHYFNQALELDSTYALAYAGLADTYQIMGWHGWFRKIDAFNKGKELALKALSIDINIAEAHATLGSILYAQEWKWEAAEKELKLALSLKPNYPTGHQYYSELLEVLGKRKEAREQIDLALKFDPNSYIINSISASLYLKDGRLDKALIDATKAKEIDKNQEWTYWLIFEIYWKQGYDEKAITEMEVWWNSDPNTIEMVDAARDAYEKSGIKGIYKYMIDYDIENDYAYDQPNLMAQKYAFLEEKEKALEWLEISFEQRDLGRVTIKADPYFEILYNEPRFIALLEKMGLDSPEYP